jgi:hypothetical protein
MASQHDDCELCWAICASVYVALELMLNETEATGVLTPLLVWHNTYRVMLPPALNPVSVVL